MLSVAGLLQGLPANGTLTAVMAYMVEDFYRPGAVMDFPKGGSGAKSAATGDDFFNDFGA